MADVARLTGLAYPTVVAVERGTRLASLSVLDTIATALNTTVRELLTDVYPWDAVEDSAP